MTKNEFDEKVNKMRYLIKIPSILSNTIGSSISSDAKFRFECFFNLKHNDEYNLWDLNKNDEESIKILMLELFYLHCIENYSYAHWS